MMDTEQRIFICPVCFQICDKEQECHAHRMIACEVGELGDERRKPVLDRSGNYVSRAPRWYLEAVGWVETTE